MFYMKNEQSRFAVGGGKDTQPNRALLGRSLTLFVFRSPNSTTGGLGITSGARDISAVPAGTARWSFSYDFISCFRS